jgi:hypothetical protein
VALFFAICVSQIQADECHLTPVIHKLQYPGCQEKRIPSYACVGRCTSYVKVSGSKIWQTERSCMCCQESGERVAVVSLDCPNAPSSQPKSREVSTKVVIYQGYCQPVSLFIIETINRLYKRCWPYMVSIQNFFFWNKSIPYAHH